MLQDSLVLSQELLLNLAGVGTRLLQATVLLILGLIVATLVRNLVLRSLQRAPLELQFLASRVAYLVVLVAAVLWILSALHVETALVATFLGAVTLALSLSLQDVARNLVSGMYLLMERPFRVGDQISVGGIAGRVEYVGVRATRLRTEAGELVIIPNMTLLSGVVTCFSSSCKVPAPSPASPETIDPS